GVHDDCPELKPKSRFLKSGSRLAPRARNYGFGAGWMLDHLHSSRWRGRFLVSHRESTGTIGCLLVRDLAPPSHRGTIRHRLRRTSRTIGRRAMRTFVNDTRVLMTKSGGFPPREPPSEPSPVKPAHCEPENDRRKDQGQPCHPRGPAP